MLSYRLSDVLRTMGACYDRSFAQWVEARPDSTLDELWDECPRGDWMLWIAARAGCDQRSVVHAACDCAESVLAYIPAGEERPRRAIEVARRWARGEATLDDVRAAGIDANNAAHIDSDTDAAATAAYATAMVATCVVNYDAATAACVVLCAADAAAAAAYAADTASAAAAHASSLSRSAHIVRARIDAAMIVAALDAYCAARVER
jgi:hypothetical protein